MGKGRVWLKLFLLLLLPLSPTMVPSLMAVPSEIAQANNPQQAEADRLIQLAKDQINTSQFEQSLQSAEQALQLYRQLQDRSGQVEALRMVGNAYYFLSNYEQATAFYQQSAELARKLGDRVREGKVLGNLGGIAYARGNYAQALTYFQQSLEIALVVKDRLVEENALSNLGILYSDLGDYQQALLYQQQGLAIARLNQNRPGEASSLNNLGLSYIALEQYSEAIAAYQQALAIFRELNNRLGEATVLGNLGTVYNKQGKYAQAIEYQQQRLNLVQELKDRLGNAQVLVNLSNTYFQLKDYEKTIQFAQAALKVAQEINTPLITAGALHNLGTSLAVSNRANQAEKYLLDSIQVYESMRDGLKDADRVSIADTQRNPYQVLQQVLVVQGKIESALEISERGRARAFVELLAGRGQVNAANRQATVQPIKIADIKKIAQTRQATLVEYAFVSEATTKLYIWVVRPSGEVAFRKVDFTPLVQNQQALVSLVMDSRASLGVRGIQFNETAQPVPPTSASFQNPRLRELHTLLIKPIADLLPSNPNAPVIFVPQSELFLVPFAALQDQSGKYLIERHTILIAPSIQVLQLTQARRGTGKGGEVLIVGNPTMPKVKFGAGAATQLPALPGAEKEAKAIAALFKTQPLVGAQATESAVLQRLSQARLIHLATHGLLDDFGGATIPGAIALAPDRQRDGLLTAEELLSLKLQAELVILSACDTGRGRITGDGVIGLSRSLMVAGVPTVIVSLWQVPDAPTAFLMTQFYQNWQRDPNKAQAMRQAMLKTMEEYPDPRSWAAFTVVGDGN
ncbi:hypothetical protein BST81_01315 [Leptolyngbya sp. 'hensonii']|uniref:CHAT domain-containing protein n=1 Tax=Leptolyngbya sp. 'hensonii' TaxID=1922337 RepID=UPI00094FE596|nr:CHAT domain-containing tetratricopeptide repeat protein [Leptolyngbya sp. 'hensonii']OLP20395.1 hypothetical protein BST81_01315 [Leptolyngbya sp. 'hensonii']